MTVEEFEKMSMRYKEYFTQKQACNTMESLYDQIKDINLDSDLLLEITGFKDLIGLRIKGRTLKLIVLRLKTDEYALLESLKREFENQ